MGGAGPGEEAPDARGVRADRRRGRSPGRARGGDAATVGPERERLVREIFRNLVTAEGTRAAAEREELLSVFAAPGSGRERRERPGRLVDARLLTEYEGPRGAGRAKSSQRRDRPRVLSTHGPARAVAGPGCGRGAASGPAPAGRAPWDEKGRPESCSGRGARTGYRLWQARYPGGSRARGGLPAREDRLRRSAPPAEVQRLRDRPAPWPRPSPWSPCRSGAGARLTGRKAKRRACGPKPASRSPWASSSSSQISPRPCLRHEEPRAGRHRRGPAIRPARPAACGEKMNPRSANPPPIHRWD